MHSHEVPTFAGTTHTSAVLCQRSHHSTAGHSPPPLLRTHTRVACMRTPQLVSSIRRVTGSLQSLPVLNGHRWCEHRMEGQMMRMLKRGTVTSMGTQRRRRRRTWRACPVTKTRTPRSMTSSWPSSPRCASATHSYLQAVSVIWDSGTPWSGSCLEDREHVISQGRSHILAVVSRRLGSAVQAFSCA